MRYFVQKSSNDKSKTHMQAKKQNKQRKINAISIGHHEGLIINSH